MPSVSAIVMASVADNANCACMVCDSALFKFSTILKNIAIPITLTSAYAMFYVILDANCARMDSTSVTVMFSAMDCAN